MNDDHRQKILLIIQRLSSLQKSCCQLDDKKMSHHVTTTRGDVTVHALALGVRQRWAKDVYDYTRICMFVHACLLVVELLSLRNFAHIILQL